MLYIPPAFRETDPATLHAVIRDARLAILVCAALDGAMPWVTHLPLMLDAEDGPLGTLHGHVAKANGHWQALVRASRALVIFTGPDAYVSPAHYASKREHGKVVPTWNYVAVHAECDAEIYHDAARLHAVVSRLTDQHEGARAEPWAVGDAPEPFIAGQLKGIVGVALRITALEGKRKLSQNRSAEDRAGVKTGLADSADGGDRDLARLME
ncbi:FMN-binding negative transcriptional regulator [Roseomonas arctica]|uniref:FMN-binding negative transcriptional regulator n=2 Tax=Plastoroseomonas arctica TaxID=1509237 RepID=A0AAF1K1Y6_9PROT|nr:FMN-binding negative transcriptional regulator [Plastoroseomonas arctica]MBR0655383.1 FMN-binding negative transcriptional regulator [Plastoroseomonas arctica]